MQASNIAETSEENMEAGRKCRIPAHWTCYREVVRGAITEAVKSYSRQKSRKGMEKAIEEFILDDKSMKNVAKHTKVPRSTLEGYIRKARDLIAKVLGQEAIVTELKAAITAETTFEELKEMLSQMNKADETTEDLVIDKPVPETVLKDLSKELQKNDHSTNRYASNPSLAISLHTVEKKMSSGKKRVSEGSIGVASKKTNVIDQEPSSPDQIQGDNIPKKILEKQRIDKEKGIAQNIEQAKGIPLEKMMNVKWVVKTNLSNRLGRIQSALQNLTTQNAEIQNSLLDAGKTAPQHLPCDCFFPLIDGDCALLIDGKQIRVNKALLSIYSKYFEDLFRKTAEPIAIEDVDYEEFILLLKHIYPMLEKEEISETNVESLLKSAIRFRVMPVIKQCEGFLKKCTVDKISVCKKLVIAQTFRLEELQSARTGKTVTFDQLGALQKDVEYLISIFKAIVEKLAEVNATL